MNRILLIAAVMLLMRCGQKKNEIIHIFPADENDTIVIRDNVFFEPEFINGEQHKMSFNESYRIVTIDRCEYVVYINGINASIIHKANCGNHGEGIGGIRFEPVETPNIHH
jgi:hypothetical protein